MRDRDRSLIDCTSNLEEMNMDSVVIIINMRGNVFIYLASEELSIQSVMMMQLRPPHHHLYQRNIFTGLVASDNAHGTQVN